MMPARKEREPRGVYIDRLNGWVRSVNSKGQEVAFAMTDEMFGLDIIAQAFGMELDAIDPVPDETTPRRPTSSDLRHLRLLR